jgi:catechol 2,3-dioxygenase-like lactoylglutathione lyase family enzyme
MRGLALFVAGALVGIAATSMAETHSRNSGVVGINHVALAVPDIDKAVEYYTKVMGFPEAFRVRNPKGEVQLVYVQVSRDTFIEIQTINAERPAGIYHFGVVVDDMAQATAMWKERGADVRAITPSSGTKAILSNVYDPNGVRMELLQLPPDSLHSQATKHWQ